MKKIQMQKKKYENRKEEKSHRGYKARNIILIINALSSEFIAQISWLIINIVQIIYDTFFTSKWKFIFFSSSLFAHRAQALLHKREHKIFLCWLNKIDKKYNFATIKKWRETFFLCLHCELAFPISKKDLKLDF